MHAVAAHVITSASIDPDEASRQIPSFSHVVGRGRCRQKKRPQGSESMRRDSRVTAAVTHTRARGWNLAEAYTSTCSRRDRIFTTSNTPDDVPLGTHPARTYHRREVERVEEPSVMTRTSPLCLRAASVDLLKDDMHATLPLDRGMGLHFVRPCYLNTPWKCRLDTV